MQNNDQSEIDKRIKSFRYAFEGAWYVLRTQKNAWIHAAFMIAVVIMGLWLKLPRYDWVLLVIIMAVVWITEFFNTALEAIVDMTMPKPHPCAKIAKDVGAGAVLVGAIAAVLVGLMILGPPLWSVISG
ncbi:MAG: diacylglycerol kinase family protein [Candidatus Promineifilaceae bacterium]|nr:diacylglycerol kinase family protein [Candidatus Promineifilaceae bacterium]